MASPTRWTEFEWTPGVGDGQGGLACCNSWGHKESDTTERLNWTELNVVFLAFSSNISNFLYFPQTMYFPHTTFPACISYLHQFTYWYMSINLLSLLSHWIVPIEWVKWVSEVIESCLTLCDPVDCSPPGSCIHGILQSRILECVAISFSRISSQPRDRTQVSRIAGRCFNFWGTRKAQ